MAMGLKTDMQQFEAIISQSIVQYEVILNFLQKMDKEIGTAAPEELLEFSKELAELQNQAATIDQVLLTQFSMLTARPETLQALIDKRQRIMKEILLVNERITEKASGVKSLIAYEMEKLRNGISAMSGYKQQQNNQGRIVDRTS
jgi:hypothetical protein